MLDFSRIRHYHTHSDGLQWKGLLRELGPGTIIEDLVRIFHPKNVFIGDSCFIGHQTIIDGYHLGHVRIGAGSWIGAFCFFHGAGGIDIGKAVGIGPRVTMLTSEHELCDTKIPILHAKLKSEAIDIGDGADIGAAAVILPGIKIGEGAAVGAGAVVTKNVPAFTVVAGNPARIIRHRN